MHLTRLANTAIDRVSAERDKIIGEIVDFAGSDLVCYRTDDATALADRQTELWDPVIDWARREIDAPFMVTTGVMHMPQPSAALGAMKTRIMAMPDFTIAALHNLTTLTGSALLAAMLQANKLTPAQAWQAAHVDEDWQIAHWGEDAEAAFRRMRRKAEFDACFRFLKLLE
jgi:chaperone required for assembly of F1-ATPase